MSEKPKNGDEWISMPRRDVCDLCRRWPMLCADRPGGGHADPTAVMWAVLEGCAERYRVMLGPEAIILWGLPQNHRVQHVRPSDPNWVH